MTTSIPTSIRLQTEKGINVHAILPQQHSGTFSQRKTYDLEVLRKIDRDDFSLIWEDGFVVLIPFKGHPDCLRDIWGVTNQLAE